MLCLCRIPTQLVCPALPRINSALCFSSVSMEILMFSYILSDVFHGPMQICSQVQARFTLQFQQRTQQHPSGCLMASS
jgi:hypothetical protein